MIHTTSPVHRRLMLALVIPTLLVAGLSACSESPASDSVPADTLAAAQTAQLRSLAQHAVKEGVPGVIVRVAKGDGTVIQLSRQSDQTKADHILGVEDEFRMGSNTKTMVATLVLQLVAENRITLDEPIDTLLPGAIPNGRNITVRMLLNHTSGLFNYVNDPAVLTSFTGQDDRDWTPEELLAKGIAYPVTNAPGDAFAYSNTNYVALGLVLEKVTGQTVADLIQERIAKPLKLKHTYLSASSVRPSTMDSPQLAHGYEPDARILAPMLPEGPPAGTAFAGTANGDLVDTSWINSSSQWAAGAMVSTAAEWATFDSALMSGELIPQAQLDAMRVTVPEDPTAPNGSGYGLGLRKVAFPCGTVWGHDGQVGGYDSQTFTDGTGKRTVEVLSTTVFGLYVPQAGAARNALLDAAVCAMFDKPVVVNDVR